MVTRCKKALLRTLAFVLWASFSTWLFVEVEKTETDDVTVKYQLLRSLYEFMASKYNMSIDEFNNFSNTAYEALSTPKPKWNYHTASDFIFQAFTTIGYGYITPQTTAGRILCIFICLLGIPITMLALKSVGEVIAYAVSGIITKFEKKILKRLEPKNVQTKSALALFLLMNISFITGGILQVWKGFTLFEGIYFWFVTCSTIGFGDYVPYRMAGRILKLTPHDRESFAREEVHDIYRAVYFIMESVIGLCVVSSVLNSIMAAMEERNWCPRCPRCPRCIPSRKTNDPFNVEQNSVQQQVRAEVGDGAYETENVTVLSMNQIK